MKIDFRNDFWDGLSPVLVKELRQGLRSGWFAKTYLIAQVLLCLMVILQAANALSADKIADRNISDIVGGLYWTMIGCILFLRAPIQALGGVSQEVQGKTLELLALTRQTSQKLVWGKWLSVMIQSLLLVVSVLPYGMIRYYFGQINVAEELTIIFRMICISGLMVAFGLGISALSGVFKAAMVFLTFVGSGMIMQLCFKTTGLRGMDILTYTMILGGGTLLTLFFLELGASWISPVSENTAWRLRFTGFTGWCWVIVVLCLDLPKDVVQIMVTMVGIVTTYLLLEGMRDCREVQWAHVRDILSWPKWIRWTGLFFYPGWQSALLFSLLLLGMETGYVVFYNKNFSALDCLEFCFVTITTLGFPMVLISRSWWKWGKGFWSYWIVQVLLCMPLVVLFPMSIFNHQLFYAVIPFPPGSWLLALYNWTKGSVIGSKDWEISPEMQRGIWIYHALILGVLLTMSIPYWRKIREMKIKRGAVV